MSLIKYIEFEEPMNIKGQKTGARQLANVEGTIGRDGVSLPFMQKAPAGASNSEPEDCEALIPWARIRQVVRARETVKK